MNCENVQYKCKIKIGETESEVYENFVVSFQFFCKSKTILN